MRRIFTFSEVLSLPLVDAQASSPGFLGCSSVTCPSVFASVLFVVNSFFFFFFFFFVFFRVISLSLFFSYCLTVIHPSESW